MLLIGYKALETLELMVHMLTDDIRVVKFIIRLRNQTWKSGLVMNLTFSLDMVGQVGSEDFEGLKVTASAKSIF